MEWSDEQKKLAEEAVEKNSQVKFTEEEIAKIKGTQSMKWDAFYGIHQNKFFKDRHWLFTEFPELVPNKSAAAPERVYPENDEVVNKMSSLSAVESTECGRKIFELGSGVGNSNYE